MLNAWAEYPPIPAFSPVFALGKCQRVSVAACYETRGAGRLGATRAQIFARRDAGWDRGFCELGSGHYQMKKTLHPSRMERPFRGHTEA